jgi:hypothetical protein
MKDPVKKLRRETRVETERQLDEAIESPFRRATRLRRRTPRQGPPTTRRKQSASAGPGGGAGNDRILRVGSAGSQPPRPGRGCEPFELQWSMQPNLQSSSSLRLKPSVTGKGADGATTAPSGAASAVAFAKSPLWRCIA